MPLFKSFQHLAMFVYWPYLYAQFTIFIDIVKGKVCLIAFINTKWVKDTLLLAYIRSDSFPKGVLLLWKDKSLSLEYKNIFYLNILHKEYGTLVDKHWDMLKDTKGMWSLEPSKKPFTIYVIQQDRKCWWLYNLLVRSRSRNACKGGYSYTSLP